jgi:ribonucleotide monophosphatase NagD (HAD superfamily)
VDGVMDTACEAQLRVALCDAAYDNAFVTDHPDYGDAQSFEALFHAQPDDVWYRDEAGKPYAPIYDRALSLAEGLLGRAVDKSRVLAIGDAIRTDVKGACDFGVDALFITAGVHRDELHPTAALDEAAFHALAASLESKPRAAMTGLRW